MVHTTRGDTNTSLNGAPSSSRATAGREEQKFPAVGSAEIDREVAVSPDDESTLARRGARFSLFKWFKRGNRDSVSGAVLADKKEKLVDGTERERKRGERPGSVCSSTGSVDTLFSTTTVHSFAFHSGTLHGYGGYPVDVLTQRLREVGPFGAGASKVLGTRDNGNGGGGASATEEADYTLPNVLSRRNDVTVRYSLQPSVFSSCDNLPRSGRLYGSASDLGERAKSSTTPGRRVHVKGKRRAPNPPAEKSENVKVNASVVREPSRGSGSRRKRPAPPRPSEKNCQTGGGGGGGGGGALRAKVCKAEQRLSDVPRSRSRADAKARERESEKSVSRLSDGASREKVLGEGTTTGGMSVAPNDRDDRTISNDTLVLQGGVLLPRGEMQSLSAKSTDSGMEIRGTQNRTSLPSAGAATTNATPRPWYKRSVFEHSRDSGSSSRRVDLFRNLSSPDSREECGQGGRAPLDASLSRLNFFHRGDDKKRDGKRKSGLTILTNISELDKEAAAIVQEEQAKGRVSMLLQAFADPGRPVSEEVVHEMVASTMESSPRRGTRALISKFNAIGNITKVTVNSSFFARSAPSDGTRQAPKFDVTRNVPYEHGGGKFSTRNSRNVSVERDISRYFFPNSSNKAGESRARSSAEKIVESRLKAASERNAKQCSVETKNNAAESSGARATVAVTEDAKDLLAPQTNIEVKQRCAVAREGEARKEGLSEKNGERRAAPTTEKEPEQASSAVPPVPEDTEEERFADKRVNAMRKEFSDILSEIDEQLPFADFKLCVPRTTSANEEASKAAEAGTSAQPPTVLDLVAEVERDEKRKVARSASKNSSAATEGESKDGKSRKPKPVNLSTIEDPATTDLKEMLKEMKHSLPKRPKAKKADASVAAEQPVKVIRSVEIAVTREDASPNASRSQETSRARSKFLFPSEERENDRHRVSSSAQTSGNVRRVVPGEASSSKTAWKPENASFTTTRKSAKSSGLAKNTFYLMQPREFAQIEAIKTNKGRYKENTYANVIEESLYANALVFPLKSAHVTASTSAKATANERNKGSPGLRPDDRRMKELPAVPEDEFPGSSTLQQNMNTLAVNKLLRKLEAAIASGHHQQAAGLAKELARLKIHCSVVRQRTSTNAQGKADIFVNVNMYIEDKTAHQGPIPLQLPTSMTVAQLKTKVHVEFEIPTTVQRWIIGKNLADNDNSTLDDLQAIEGSPIFLYLVAPEQKNEEATHAEKSLTELPESIERADTSVPVESIPQAEPDVPVPLQEECTPEETKLERYEELMSLENCDVIPNSEPIDCPVCFVTYGPREGVILRDCLHMFCRMCIANTIQYCDEAEVKCPYRDTEYTCESTLQEREIKALVSPEMYQQHLAKSIAQAEKNAGNNAFHCKTPDCPGWCIYDDNVNIFLCPVCAANNCLTCQVVHAGKNCREYQEELRLSKETDHESRRTAAMLEEMVDRGEALACPTCAVVLMKKWGCDWLRCSMCKTEICWVTRGPRWGPGGKGDTSGGCRCGENGVKCHPRCNYCH